MYRNKQRGNKKSQSNAKKLAALKGCASVLVKLNFTNDSEGQSTPGMVKAKIYFQRQEERRMIEILKHLQIGRSEKQEDQKNILSQYEINPETCAPGSLLNFDHRFQEEDLRRTHSSYIDVNLRVSLPIVMVEIQDRLKYGRVTLVSAGKKNKENNAKALPVMQKWTPLWTRHVGNGRKGRKGGTDSQVYSPQDKSGKDLECDVIRFQFEFNSEVEKYNFISIDEVDMQAFNSQTTVTRPVPTKSQPVVVTATTSKEPKPVQLCTDIWLRILDLLPASSRLTSLVALAGVCKEWRRFFCKKEFYTCVDLKPLATVIPTASVEFHRFLFNNCKSTSHLRVSWLPCFPEKFQLGDMIDHLEPGVLNTFIADNCGYADDALLKKLVKTQPNLKTLSLHGCFAISPDGYKVLGELTNLERLSLGNTDALSIEGLRLVAKNCRKLEVFECSNLLRIYPYRDEDPSTVMAEVLSTMASPNLRAVKSRVYFKHVSETKNSINGEQDFLSSFISKCKNLEELYLNDYIDARRLMEAVDRNSQTPFGANLRRISRVMFEHVHRDDDDEEEEEEDDDDDEDGIEIRERRRLQTLDNGVPVIEAFSKMLKNFPKLERLGLFDDGCDKTWNVGEILQNARQLRQLFIWQGCSEIPTSKSKRQAIRERRAAGGDIDDVVKMRYPTCLIVLRPAEFSEDEDYYDEKDLYCGESDYDSSDEDEIDCDYYMELYGDEFGFGSDDYYDECSKPDDDDDKLGWYMAMDRKYNPDMYDFDY